MITPALLIVVGSPKLMDPLPANRISPYCSELTVTGGNCQWTHIY